MSTKQEAAKHWLINAASWRDTKPTVTVLRDVCRYCTRDGYVVTCAAPYRGGMGTVIIATPTDPSNFHRRGFYMVRAMGSPVALLRAVEAWAEVNK
jgi:hypothetical protein